MKIEKITPRSLRQLATDLLYQTSGDPSAAAAMQGHSERTALRHYRRVRPAEIQRAAALAGLGSRPAPAAEAKVSELDAARRKRDGGGPT